MEDKNPVRLNRLDYVIGRVLEQQSEPIALEKLGAIIAYLQSLIIERGSVWNSNETFTFMTGGCYLGYFDTTLLNAESGRSCYFSILPAPKPNVIGLRIDPIKPLYTIAITDFGRKSLVYNEDTIDISLKGQSSRAVDVFLDKWLPSVLTSSGEKLSQLTHIGFGMNFTYATFTWDDFIANSFLDINLREQVKEHIDYDRAMERHGLR